MPRSTQKIKVSHHYPSSRGQKVESPRQSGLVGVPFCNAPTVWCVQTQTQPSSIFSKELHTSTRLDPFPRGVGSATNGNADTQQMFHRLLFRRHSGLCVPNPSILTSLLQDILHRISHPESLTVLSHWNCPPGCSLVFTAGT